MLSMHPHRTYPFFMSHFSNSRTLRLIHHSLAAAGLAAIFSTSANAQVLTFNSGATTWDGSTANWLTPVGESVTYNNSTNTQPTFFGPVIVDVAVPRTDRKSVV